MKVIKRTPLTDSQMGVYLECNQRPEGLQYNLKFEYAFPKTFSAIKLKQACDKVLAHFASFSTVISMESGTPELAQTDMIPVTGCQTVSDDEYLRIAAGYFRPFVLEDQLLCRVDVFDTPSAVHLLMNIHHIVFDGTSALVFEKALELAYKGQPIPEEQEYTTAASQDSYDYFDNLLSGVETDSNILPDLAGTDMNHCYDLHEDLEVPALDIESFAKSLGVTPNVVLLSAFAYALAQYSGQNDALLTSICSGRRGLPIENNIGFFVRTFPLYFQSDGEMTVRDFIAHVKDRYFGSMIHSDASFVELASRYGIRSDIKYVYQGTLLRDIVFDGQHVEKYLRETGEALSNLDFIVTREKDCFHLRLTYRNALYSKENIESFVKLYTCIVKGMLTCQKLKDIVLASDFEGFNDTDREYDRTKTVWDLLPQRGNATAVSFMDKRMTYKQFDRLTSKLAAYLHGKGVGKEDFVAILIPRNELMAVTAWGVVRAGAAYQPLDPTYPQERLNFMVADSGAKMLIADRSLRPLLNEYQGEVFYTDQIDGLPDADFKPLDTPESALVIIYTSGTTGTPKGCILENRNIVCFYHNHVGIMGIDSSSKVATYASFGFDAGIMDIFTTLMAGAELCVVPDEIRLDMSQLNEFYKANGITHGFLTTQVGRMFVQLTDCTTLKMMAIGGEKLVPFTPPTGFTLINGYGPSETIAYVCCHKLTDAGPIQPIGRPHPNTRLYVVDKYMRMLPVGACGELCIAGGQVGRGYLNRPDKNAESFIANPFTKDSGYTRMYRTGDIVRWLPIGEIDFVGRRDGQVKIRGFRVELTEIEEVIRRYEGIKDATVMAFDDKAGGKFIAAYVVSDSVIDIQALNAFIGAEKPPYMVPAVTMQIDAIPYNQNLKVNRRALPEPKRVVTQGERHMPENDLQKRIFDIAADILGHEDFDIDTNLFEAGMTSVGMLKFNVSLGKALNRTFKISDLKENNTVRRIEALQGPSIKQYEKQQDYPLMQNQMGVFIDSSRDGSSLDYNIPCLFHLSDKVDLDKLKDALETALNAHPYTKTTLKTASDGSVRAVRNDDAPAQVDIYRVKRLPDDLVRPFDLVGGSLYRVCLIETPSDKYMFMDVHHIISDGTSMGIFLNDVNSAYAGMAVEMEEFTGFEAALDEESRRSSDAYVRSQKYYESLLSGCNTECLPAKCPQGGGDSSLSFTIDCSKAIQDWCKQHNLSLNAYFNAVFSYTLATFLHADDVSYCTVYNGRGDSRLTQSFAMLVKTLPVRCLVNPDSVIADFVQSMQKQLMDSMANDAMSFAEISSTYGVRPDIFFNYQGADFEFDVIAGQPAKMQKLDYEASKAPITIEIFLRDGMFCGEMAYRSDMFCDDFAQSLAGAINMAALGFVSQDRLGTVSLMSPAERAHFDEMNSNETTFRNAPAQTQFEEWAARQPDHVAVRTASSSLTYAQLDEMANRLAQALIANGAGGNEIIGLILDRSEYIPVAELGIMKAGCAFLPMLPTYPDERLDFCMNDAGCRFAITTSDIIEARSELLGDKALDLEKLIGEGKNERPDITIAPDQLAYCIYTSGSTGTPKGVMIEHHNFASLLQAGNMDVFELPGNTILCMSSISFDMSIFEMYGALSYGRTLYIASETEIHNLDLLHKAFVENGIDIMCVTPSFAWNLLSLPEFEGTMSRMKSVMLGAEAFPPALLSKFKSLNPQMVVLNGYGPTECTQACSFKTLEEGCTITIGGPLNNMKFYVVDDRGNLLPRFAVGELIICGEQVGRGYVGLPEKNAACFYSIDGIRAYHSGDLVRVNRDGEVEFGGRSDNQVKLRGFRVELDEVEAVMQEFPGVSQSRVIVRNNGTEDFLAGFFTADSPIDLDELTAYMRSKLTYYMVPAAMMQLDKMPMTANGKLDKKALPEIRPIRKEKKKRAPKKSLEQRILELFQSVLKQEDCSVDDNFFEIGGTSLSASNVVMQLKSDGYKIEYQDIFDHQTPEELAEYLESQNVSKSDTVRIQDGQPSGEADDVLSCNVLDNADKVERKPLGNVVLTGATGFLGCHVLKELIDSEQGHIYCIMRKGVHKDVVTRLKSMLVYYFESSFNNVFQDRITVLEGDITDSGLIGLFDGIEFDTLINCAASVKHYANDNSIEFVNVHGVENLIALCRAKNARMIQISTSSVPGVHNDETYRVHLRMTEDRLFVIDDMNNQYIQSKYKAELLMFNAIRDGLDGKVLRVGNLMGRYSDGEFQTNMHTNAFLNALRGFVAIGKCPISHSTDPMSFSPIDCTARAVVLLAGTNSMFTAFHVESRSTFDEAKLIESMNRCNIPIRPVPDEEYYADFRRMMADPESNAKVQALLTNDRPDLHMIECDNRFTANVLYRLGFSWPFIEDTYLERVIRGLYGLDFFEG